MPYAPNVLVNRSSCEPFAPKELPECIPAPDTEEII
jgi:hypothetical protein